MIPTSMLYLVFLVVRTQRSGKLCASPSSLAVSQRLLVPAAPNATKCRFVCDATFLHGLKQLEIYPAEAKGEKATGKKGTSKQGGKDEPLAQETEPRDLETAQTIIKDFNIRDLQHLAPRLQGLNDIVCFSAEIAFVPTISGREEFRLQPDLNL
jgi:hypothetical protein